MAPKVILNMDRGFHYKPEELLDELKRGQMWMMSGFFRRMQESFAIRWTIHFGIQ